MLTRGQLARVAHRLREATGYMELGMYEHASRRLEDLGELGPFEAEVDLLRGEALRAQHRFKDAASSLTAAALKLPAPHNRSALLALSLCYRQAGDTTRAVQAMGLARGAALPRRKKAT